MRWLRNPVVQFLAVSLVIIAAITVATSLLAGRAAETEALAEAADTNEVLASSVARPAIERSLVRGNAGAIDRFDTRILERLLIDQIVRVNIWTADGRIVYSSVFALIGHTFALTVEQQEALAQGTTESAVADPDAPENKVTDPQQQAFIGGQSLVRIYTGFEGPRGEPLLFEAYYSLEDIEQRRGEIFRSFQWIALSGPVALVVLVTPILWVLTRRLTSAADDRARLLGSAIDASDAERRRIARDLHDSVVQDLAGTSFSISALARDPATSPPTRSRLVEASASLRDGLKSLRSLLAEIHPPELHSVGLPAALSDLTAPAGAAGVQASVSVEGAETASDERAALVWRVAQEAVRNALRHASASTLAVTVRGDGRALVLEVVDDGVGFDPAADAVDPHSFGLRGLRSLVREAGGTLEVRSSPGEGTTVRMEVSAT